MKLKKFLKWCLIIISFMTLAGCAGVTIKPVASDDKDYKLNGFRYYEPAPYVLVYSDGKTGLTAKFIYLPDLTRKMSAHPYEFIASNTTKLNFVNGVLTDSTQKVDGTVVPKAIIDMIKTAAIAAAKAANLPTGKPEETGFAVPTPYLYKIVFDSKGINLSGAQAIMLNGKKEIRVTALNQK